MVLWASSNIIIIETILLFWEDVIWLVMYILYKYCLVEVQSNVTDG